MFLGIITRSSYYRTYTEVEVFRFKGKRRDSNCAHRISGMAHKHQDQIEDYFNIKIKNVSDLQKDCKDVSDEKKEVGDVLRILVEEDNLAPHELINDKPCLKKPCKEDGDEDSDEIQQYLKPKRLKLTEDSMRELEKVNPAAINSDYENTIIDKKNPNLLASDSKVLNLCQTSSCSNKSWEHNSVKCIHNIQDQEMLFQQISKVNEENMDFFSYTFNKEIYSGSGIEKPDSTEKGGYGKVVKFHDTTTGFQLVKKMIGKKDINLNEVKVPLLLFDENNTTKIFGCFFDTNNFNIIQEDAGIPLHLVIKDQMFYENIRKLEEILQFSLQLFTGVNALSKCNIVHCDLKPQNVCVQLNKSRFLVKLIDFGSCLTHTDSQNHGITFEYLPPDFNKYYYEKHKSKDSRSFTRPWNAKDDIWSCGLIILFIYKKKHPMAEFFHIPYNANIEEQQKSRIERCLKVGQLTDPLDKYFTSGQSTVDQLLSKVLVVNPDQRSTASEVLQCLETSFNFQKTSNASHNFQPCLVPDTNPDDSKDFPCQIQDQELEMALEDCIHYKPTCSYISNSIRYTKCNIPNFHLLFSNDAL